MKLNYRLIGAGVLVALAATTALIGQPTANERISRFATQLTAEITSRQHHIDPGELLELMYNPEVDLLVLDVRGDSDFNLFHLKDAVRVDAAGLDAAFIAAYPESAVKVVVANDETRANEAYKRLRVQGMLNVYILAGGLNFWLDVYGGSLETAAGRLDIVPADCDLGAGATLHYETARVTQPFDPAVATNGRWRHVFTAAYGDAYPAARPPIKRLPEREYEKKVVIQQAGPKVKGGCG